MKPSSEKKKQRLSLRLFNRAQRVMERLGRRKLGWVESEPSLHEAACKAVGFDDFGDEAYLEGLRVLLQAYDRESRLTPFGRMLVEQQLLGILKNRLQCFKISMYVSKYCYLHDISPSDNSVYVMTAWPAIQVQFPFFSFNAFLNALRKPRTFSLLMEISSGIPTSS